MLLEEVKIVQANLSDLPDESLDAMEEGLREGITILVKCEEAAVLLEQKIMEFRQEVEVQALLKELLVIKTRITKLLLQARQGLSTIQVSKDAKVELARQTEEMEEQKEKIAKLDRWLAEINNELKESTKQSEVLTEDDIIRYIEVYERYIREYEEYKIIIQSIVVIIRDDSSQMKQNLNKTIKTLEETRNLVILEIERLRQMLIQIRTAPEVVEDDISQTDRTIDSTSMPEEIVSPREPEYIEEPKVTEPIIEKIKTDIISKIESEPSKLETQIEEFKLREEKQVKPKTTIETQTGKSLLSESPSLVDKSVICKPEDKVMLDVSVTCAPPQEVEVQTSEVKSSDKEILENIQVTQTVSDGHETIEIASRPVTRDPKIDEQSLFIDAQYKDNNLHKDSKLNITHSLPQSFETVMVEPDETTTEVVVDADGTKRIIVKKVRKTLVTRQQIVQPQYTTGEDIPQDHSFSRLVLTEDAGSNTKFLEDGGTRFIQYQTSDGQVITGVPDSEVTIQEFTSRPDMVIKMEKGMKPEEILRLAEGEIPSHIKTSSSSVTAVVQQVTKRIVKTKRRIIRRVVIIDGKEHVTEEVVEEPDNVEVFEEQIPRVSINVKEGEKIVGNSDKQDKPPFSPSDGQGNKPGDENKGTKEDDENKFKDMKSSPKEQPIDKTLHYEKQSMESSSQQIPDLQTLTKEFLEKESEDKRKVKLKDAPIEKNVVRESFYPNESEIILHSTPQIEKDENLAEGGISFVIGDTHSTVEISSSNIATFVQKVTRKITRIRKRIIKHIQIIDGKEHVTEEVIEEPEEVEITEEEPKTSQFIENQGERQRIIRQVHFIDGKEHVTEQIVENPEDDHKSISKSVNLPSHQLNITEVFDEETPVDPSDVLKTVNIQDKNIKDSTKDLIKTEIGNLDTKKIQTRDIHTESKQLTSGEPEKREDRERGNDNLTQTHMRTILTKSRKRVIKHVQIIDGKEHVTEDVIEEPDDVQIFENEPNLSQFIQNQQQVQTKGFKIIRQVHIIDGKEHVTEHIVEDPDDSDKIVPESINDLSPKLEITEIIDQATPSSKDDAFNIETQDITKSKDLFEKETDYSKIIPTPETVPAIEKKTKKCVKNTTAEPEMKEENKIDGNTCNETHRCTTLTNTRKRIIQHIKIVDGKKHVTEEVIEEPDTKVIESTPISFIVQNEGTTTKRIKIIRQIQIIGGKEHVTERIIEDPTDEYIANSTVTATVDVQIDKSDLTPQQEKGTLDKVTTNILDDKTKISSKTDINEVLIRSETTGSETLQKPITDNDNVNKPEQLVSTKVTVDIVPSQPSDKSTKSDEEKQTTTTKSVLEIPDNIDKTTTKRVMKDQYGFTSEEKVPSLEIDKEKELHPSDISRMLIESESKHSTMLISSPKNIIEEVIQKPDFNESEEQKDVTPKQQENLLPIKSQLKEEEITDIENKPQETSSCFEGDVLSDVPKDCNTIVIISKKISTPKDILIEEEDIKQAMISKKEDITYVEPQVESVVEKPNQGADETAPIKTQDQVSVTKSVSSTSENKIDIEEETKKEQQLTSKPDKQEQNVEDNIPESTVICITDVNINKVDVEKSKDRSREVPENFDDSSEPAELSKSKILDINMSFIKGEIDQIVVKPTSGELSDKNVTEEYNQFSESDADEHPKLKQDNKQKEVLSVPDIKIKEKSASKDDLEFIDKSQNTSISKDDKKIVDQSSPKKLSLIDTTCRLIESETEHSDILSEKSKVKDLKPFEATKTIASTSVENIQEATLEDRTIVHREPEEVMKDEERAVSKVDTVKDITKEPVEYNSKQSISLPTATTDIENITKVYNQGQVMVPEEETTPNIIKTITRKRIIKHLQIIDGKEHVTEEVIDEPDEVEFIEGTPDSNINIQGEGIKTKRIKIIRQVHIIDGKEHVTEQIVEDSGDEYIPVNTITAGINLQLTESDISKKEPERYNSGGLKIKENVQDVQKEILKHVSQTDENSDSDLLKEVIKTKNTDDDDTILTSHLKGNVQGENSVFEITHNVPNIVLKDDIKIYKQKEESKDLDKEDIAISTQPSKLDTPSEKLPQSIKDITGEFLTQEITKISETFKPVETKLDNVSQEKDEKKQLEELVAISKVLDTNNEAIGSVPYNDIIYSQLTTDEIVNASLPAESHVENTIKTLHPPIQSSIQVKPVETNMVTSEFDINVECKEPEISYNQQFDLVTQDSPEIADKDSTIRSVSSEFVKPTELKDSINIVADPVKFDSKHDIAAFIKSERLDTDSRIIQDSLNLSKNKITEILPEKSLELEKLQSNLEKPVNIIKPTQTVDMTMSLSKIDTNKKYEPKIEVDVKVEEFETQKPYIIKKEVRADLPTKILIVDEYPEKEVYAKVKKELPETQSIAVESVKDETKIEHSPKDKETEESIDSIHSESYIETDKSIDGTESSSLGHYVQLQTPVSHESPNPTENLLETVIVSKHIIEEPLSASTEFEQITEKGYEPEDTSISKEPTTQKKKKHKKRKPHAISEETIYPKQTTTEEDTAVSTPVEMKEPIQQKKIKTKKSKKKTPISNKSPENITAVTPETKPESPKVGHEIVTSSPQEETYHTISETSEANTVKIVEECIGTSPEIVEKEVATTVTYPVPVVEEVPTSEYSVQTSPEVVEIDKDDKIETPKKEVIDTKLQTSPISVKEILTQTTPINEAEAQTQTSDSIKITEKVDILDSQVQTSRTESPEEIIRSEATTQVIPRDIQTPDDKFSQTSPPINEGEKEKDCRDMQTSPLPQVQKDEKSTEIIIETTESNIQTVKQDIVDQGTLTSPVKVKELTEMSIQTPDIPVVDTYTQSELSIEDMKSCKEKSPRLPELDVTSKVDTIDNSQQTTPRCEYVEAKPEVDSLKKEIILIDSTQQTSPRIERDIMSPKSSTEFIKKEIITIDDAQQTTPRDYIEIDGKSLEKYADKNNIVTIDSTQQTTPRGYSEDSISTSTDEPYEVHLHAQISIPRSDDFIENERAAGQISQHISKETNKQKKRKPKKKVESPMQSPSSLSDPINAELSYSITPTSDDLSSKETSSIDEGISQIASPVYPNQQELYITSSKPTYSDVVQRSKSKSPSPSKTVFTPKVGKARVINTLERRTQYFNEPQKVSDDPLIVALIEPSVEKSYDLVVNKELEEVKNAIQNNDPAKVEKSIIVVIETISIWLEEIQYKIQRQAIEGDKPSNESEPVKSLENYVQSLKEIIYVTELNEEIVTSIETLMRQVHTVGYLRSRTAEKVKEEEKEWHKFLSDIDVLSSSVEKLKITLDEIILSETPSQQKLDDLDEIEKDNVSNLDFTKKLFQMYRSFIEINPKRECPAKLFILDEDTKQIENTINTERDRLLQLTLLAEEYEQTLQDFGQITDVAEALLDGKIIVSNLDHLYEEIQKHRKFFVNLSHCRAILESLENNLDTETRTKYSSLHHSLHDRATIIIDRAASRAQQMTLAASRWSVLDQNMKEEQQWLTVAQQRIPDLTNVTSIDHEQYINLYQSISLDASQHYAKMIRLLSITEGLQGLIVCSGLETECSVALDTLLKLQEDVDSRLTRLTAFRENWLTYDHLIDRIEGWMKLANRELEHITPENITTTSNLRRFWELKAQHEVHNNLKNESGVQFEKALEILPISDEMVQRQFFSKIEDKWRDLSSRIHHIHSSAIKNISDRDVPSSEKLNILEDEMRELRAMLDALKGVIKSEDELNLYIERLQVMTSRIDRIQNELGRLSLLPTAESERLGALLTQSGILDDQIAEELERSMLLKEKIMQVQAGIGRCQKNQRRARLTLEECEAAERLGSDVVERASQTCEKLIEDLSTQWQDILALRQALHTLPTALRVCVSPVGVERDISALQDTHAELEAACNELSVRLRSKLQLWRRFERQLELVQGAVREADYMVELLTVQGQVDYDRLLKATEKLETLSESLSRRSAELVGSLRDAAAPLESSTEPNIAAKLRKELDDAAAAYEHTCANLTQLCDKYHKAVDLWRRYREAAACVRAFAEQHEGALHALKPHDAFAAHQACLEQEARVAELRSLAARVAAETGSRALQADADALARRLQLVAGAVQALADLGEARQIARAKAQQAKEMFCDMRQDLTPVHEDGEIVEDKLIALRENLIALGKSEADIAPAKAELPEIDRDVSDEHSIVRILELWQAMFRDTFLHYHRLSTALVRSGDAATALRLWHEYLLDLQSFLSASVPADYENLTEHRRLCRVHRNLLASQRSILMNENKESKNRDLVDKFDTLTNLHNETLARIVERHDEVCTRIAAWDEYRQVNTELLRWLKEIEREKEKLQLRYVHIKRIHKILTQIQNLTDKLPEGRKLSEKLLENLKKVMEFTEETYGASVRMEYAGIVKRVDNLQASLDTWRDFLTRILGLIGEYETLTEDLHKLYSKTQGEIMSYSDDDRLSRPQLKKAIDRYTDLRTKIDKTETQIEALSVIQEQLKECLSPQDIRIVNQKVWQLRQQRADLEHQLSIIIHRLQERLEIYAIFDSRLSRFSEWIRTLESRLETTTSISDVGAFNPQDLVRRINSDIQAETALKEREFEWLTETGSVLSELAKKDEKSYSKNTSKQLKDIQERWHKLKETGRNRIAKINELLETISQLEERLTEIRLKLHTIESNLSAPVVLEQLTTKAVDTKFQERDEIHKNIENESGEVGKTLNHCELVFNDADVLKGNFDLRNLHTGVDIVEKKWKNICEMSEQRKKALKEIRKSAELVNSLLPKVEKKLDAIEKRVEKIETRKQRGEAEDESISKAVIKDLDALEGDVKKLEDAYSRIASARGVEIRGSGADDVARLRAAVRRWQQLRCRVDAAGADAHRQFVAAHGKAVVALAEADVRLTRALHLAPTPTDKAATLKELDGVESDLRECEALVDEADRLSVSVASISGVSDMVSEYRALFADVRTRLDLARAEVVGDVDTAVQVDTLKWETDAALQVDTLTSKETYRVELATAVKETSESLEALRTALLQELKENTTSDELATAAKEIAKAGAKPEQTLELAKHLSELLLTECDATEEEAMLKEVESLSLRYEDLLTQAKKRELQINNLRLPHSASYALTCEHESGRVTCPLCSDRNWKQLDNDLWRLEQWLQFAEATDEARHDPPEQYDALEDAIQDHREFLLDLDSHKALVVSLNVVGAHVTRHARRAADAARVRERLAAANARWDAACARAAAWQARLQHALLHNAQFHDIVEQLVEQLAAAERSVRAREPLRLARPAAELRDDFRRFSELRDELSRAEPRVLALRDAAQLLRDDAQHVCRRLGELRLRLQSLRKLSGVYALKLGAALARSPQHSSALAAAAASASATAQLLEETLPATLPPLDDTDALNEERERRELSGIRRGLRFVCRVARASLPFQALLLLLLGAAALAPLAPSDCRSNTHSLTPVLRYPHGPPPL